MLPAVPRTDFSPVAWGETRLGSRRRILLVQAPASELPLHSLLIESGWEVRVAGDLAGAKRASRDGCQVGLAVVDPVELWPPPSLEELTAGGALEWIALLPREALQNPVLCRTIVDGFYDFHTLPLDVDRLRVVLGHALGKAELAASLARNGNSAGMYGMVGRSAGMLELYRNIDKVARFDAPVLISGESGTGKEVTARAIHRLSARSRGPFIPVNCGSLPVNLVHSELFGHEKGSFTGAYQRKIGSIQAADGGVVFLDEIGDLPLELQSSLLRFLQEKTIVRVGANQLIRIDARVIAASHVDLWESVKRGRFREDLYYRLNVLHLHIPPLRERIGDIALLAQAFFEQAGAQKSPQVTGFASEAIAAMEAYGWPGNVRELMNRGQKAMIMCDKRLITASDLGFGARAVMPEATSLRKVRGLIERDVIRQTLLINGRNVAAAARQLGVSRTTLYRLLQKFEIEVRLSDVDSRRWARTERDHVPS